MFQAEAAFRPWWDSVEDNIVYTILILALFLLPTSVLITTSLDCTYCQVQKNTKNVQKNRSIQTWKSPRLFSDKNIMNSFLTDN